MQLFIHLVRPNSSLEGTTHVGKFCGGGQWVTLIPLKAQMTRISQHIHRPLHDSLALTLDCMAFAPFSTTAGQFGCVGNHARKFESHQYGDHYPATP